MSVFTDAVARELDGCEAFSVGARPGCAECGLADCEDMNCEEYELAAESHFSWSACDSCASTLGGDRSPAHFMFAGWEKLPVEERVIHHCEVCVDCLMYHANGEEPESWER